MLALLESLQLGFVARHGFYPAGLVEADGFPAALGAIFVLEAVLNDFELQLSDGADDLAIVELIDEELCHAFVHELVDAFLQLLGLHRVGVLDVLEHLGREGWQAAIVQLLAFRERVANLEDAVVGQADDVTRPSLVNGLLSLRHELRGTGEAERLALTDVQVGCVADELTGAYFAERDAGAMVGVDVGRYLEDEAGELRFVGRDGSLLGNRGPRTGRYLHEAVEQFLHAEVVQGRAEEDGRHVGIEIRLHVEFGIDAIHELEVLAELGGVAFADTVVELGRTELHSDLFGDLLLVGREEVEVVLKDVVDALELGALIDGPGERTHANLQLFLQFVEQVEGVLALAVHLVDEDDDGRLPHAADFHELSCLSLDALGAVDDDDGAVDGRQGAEGVLREVLVTRCVEDSRRTSPRMAI